MAHEAGIYKNVASWALYWCIFGGLQNANQNGARLEASLKAGNLRRTAAMGMDIQPNWNQLTIVLVTFIIHFKGHISQESLPHRTHLTVSLASMQKPPYSMTKPRTGEPT